MVELSSGGAEPQTNSEEMRAISISAISGTLASAFAAVGSIVTMSTGIGAIVARPLDGNPVGSVCSASAPKWRLSMVRSRHSLSHSLSYIHAKDRKASQKAPVDIEALKNDMLAQ